MRLQNIHNDKSKIYLFLRSLNGKQKIVIDNTFKPFFYEPSPNGKYTAVDGTKLKKIICKEPKDIPIRRSENSYSSDILYTTNYLIHKVNKIEPCKIKWLMFDIEIETPKDSTVTVDEMTEKPVYPITYITIYNNFTNEYTTLSLEDYKGNDKKLVDDFINYVKKESPDLLLAWNIDFDYTYLYNKTPNFAKRISPINKARHGKQGMLYPAGISIVDYKGLYEKLTLGRKRSYALDYIAQDELEEKSWGKTDFSEASEHVKEKNINDVRRMVKIEEKRNIIPLFDIRRQMSKCYWEDLPVEYIKRKDPDTGKKISIKTSNNSRIIDFLILEEAKLKGVVLPNKNRTNKSDIDLSGAYRQCFKQGKFKNIGKFDLSSAYPQMIKDFCLDPYNLNTQGEGIKIELTSRENNILLGTFYFKQNKNAILPSVVDKLLTLKNSTKEQLSGADDDTIKDLKLKYDSIKAMVNSVYGVLGNKYFRMYDIIVANTVTFLVRDLLMYIIQQLNNKGYEVIYADTDSVFINTKKDITPLLNSLIKQWGKDKYNNDNVNIKFEYEGIFTKLLILGLTHYYGYVKDKKGIERPEKKGLESKKSNTPKFEAKFQEALIEEVLKWKSINELKSWIREEQEKLKNTDLLDISIPAKINSVNYKSLPIWVRAVENTKMFFPDFHVQLGEPFYYIYTTNLGRDNNGKKIDVIAFTEETKYMINKNQIDWKKMEERLIHGKADNIFISLGEVYSSKNKGGFF